MCSFLSIILGLGNIAVSRLSQTWEVADVDSFSLQKHETYPYMYGICNCTTMCRYAID